MNVCVRQTAVGECMPAVSNSSLRYMTSWKERGESSSSCLLWRSGPTGVTHLTPRRRGVLISSTLELLSPLGWKEVAKGGGRWQYACGSLYWCGSPWMHTASVKSWAHPIILLWRLTCAQTRICDRFIEQSRSSNKAFNGIFPRLHIKALSGQYCGGGVPVQPHPFKALPSQPTPTSRKKNKKKRARAWRQGRKTREMGGGGGN